jgi:hypothetical protein
MKRLGALLAALALAGVAHGQSTTAGRVGTDVDASTYGVTCNGSTDDTAAFDAAIKAVNASPGNLTIPAGTCIISRSLTAITASGVTIRGAGPNATVMAPDCANCTTFTLAGQFSQVADLAIVPKVFQTAKPAIVVAGGFKNLIHNVHIQGAYDGIWVTSSAEVSADHIDLRYLTGANGILVSGRSGAPTSGFQAAFLTADNPYPATFTRVRPFTAGAAYDVGDVFVSGGWVFQVTTAGTSGPSPPAAPSTANWYASSVANGSLQVRAITNTSLTWIRQDSYANSLTLVHGALLDAAYGLRMTDSAATGDSYPQWFYAYDLEADHNFESGTSAEAGIGLHLTGSWVGSTLHGNGIQFVSGFKGEGSIDSTRVLGCYLNGIVLGAGPDVKINNNIVANNSTAGKALYNGIAVASGVVRFTIQGNSVGFIAPFTSTNQGYGIVVLPGASNYYMITGNMGVGNVRASVSDGGRGANKVVANNL